jgi:hypothetical protein
MGYFAGLGLVVLGLVGLVAASQVKAGGRRIAVGAVLALVLGSIVMLIAASDGPAFFGPSSAELEAKAHEQAKREARIGEQEAARADERKKAERGAAAELERTRAAAVHAAMVADFAKLTPAARASKMRASCDPDGAFKVCDDETVQALAEAGASEAEKMQLRALATKQLEAFAATKKAAERERYAAAFDRRLLARQMNPDGVTAEGPEKKTLRIKIWACSRQMLSDIAGSELGDELRAKGFARVECSSATLTGSVDL